MRNTDIVVVPRGLLSDLAPDAFEAVRRADVVVDETGEILKNRDGETGFVNRWWLILGKIAGQDFTK